MQLASACESCAGRRAERFVQQQDFGSTASAPERSAGVVR
jgi:hypothetical protein